MIKEAIDSTEVRGITKIKDGIGTPSAKIEVIRSSDKDEFNELLKDALKDGFKIIQPIEHIATDKYLYHVAVIGKGNVLPG